MTLECVVNVSEGRDPDVLRRLTEACGEDLLDIHTDAHHNRSVLTLVGEAAPRRLAEVAVAEIDLGRHRGVHPRLGAVDVVPFVGLDGEDPRPARNRFAHWAAETLGLPCFLYGPERSLPDVRRGAFTSIGPDTGPADPHPTAGACAVGSRDLLIAYNVWLGPDDLEVARQVARTVRGPHLRALGLEVGERTQVSMNLVAPEVLGPADAYDIVATEAASRGGVVTGAELVGLLPRRVLDRIPPSRWGQLDLDGTRTIEHRLADRNSRRRL
jgi:glutamate formiminotransferase / 5-formyltetrahydrofolate cyclo-ligase